MHLEISPPITDPQSRPIKKIGFCEGCGCCIAYGEEYREFEDVLLHDDAICIKGWVAKHTVRKIAGQ